MSKPGRRVVIADWEAKQHEKNTIVLDLGDAGEITIDPPLFWRRRTNQLPKKATVEQWLNAVVGEEQVQKWTDTGRTLEELDAVITDALGMPSGESSASSPS